MTQREKKSERQIITCKVIVPPHLGICSANQNVDGIFHIVTHKDDGLDSICDRHDIVQGGVPYPFCGVRSLTTSVIQKMRFNLPPAHASIRRMVPLYTGAYACKHCVAALHRDREEDAVLVHYTFIVPGDPNTRSDMRFIGDLDFDLLRK